MPLFETTTAQAFLRCINYAVSEHLHIHEWTTCHLYMEFKQLDPYHTGRASIKYDRYTYMYVGLLHLLNNMYVATVNSQHLVLVVDICPGLQ